MGQHKEAYHYAVRHLEICRDTGDRMGQATAQLNIAELSRVLGYPEGARSSLPQLNAKLSPIRPPNQQQQLQQLTDMSNSFDSCNQRRLSMDHMDLLKLTPDAKHAKTKDDLEIDGDDTAADIDNRSGKENNSLNGSGFLDEEEFFDFISRFQSKRMDDQRCSLSVASLSNR
jgi:G-protein signaling modulator 2